MVFRHGSHGIRFDPFQSVAPFRADSDGAFPGLKAWAVLLNRFAVRSIDLCINIRVKTPGENVIGVGRSRGLRQIEM